jgi:hypothetical protein
MKSVYLLQLTIRILSRINKHLLKKDLTFFSIIWIYFSIIMEYADDGDLL